MSVSSIIDTASSGLRATQAGLDVVSQNVANSGSVGYTRRTLNSQEVVSGNRTTGVNVTGAQRALDTLLQKQLRLETAGAAYTGVLADAHKTLDAAFDQTEGAGSLSSLINNFKGSLQSLVTTPSITQGRADVVNAATDLAGSLNSLSAQVQTMRNSAESSLAGDVKTANGLLQQIANLNRTMVASADNASSAGLQDQRDALIDQLSGLMDLKVTTTPAGAVNVLTTSGLQLVDGANATTLSFDQHSPLAPESAYSTDPNKRSVGTITATDAMGNKTDLIATGAIRSGEIAAYVELRDKTLPEAQTQLDAVAAGLASAMSDQKVSGAPATVAGVGTGFDLDVSGLQSGNAITLNYTSGGVAGSISFVKVNNPAALPLTGPLPGGAGPTIGIDFSGGMASVATQIQAALGSGFTVSASGSTLEILDDGAANTTDVTALSANATVSTVQVTPPATGTPEMPLFVDGGRNNAAYTGSFDTSSQLVGFAGRITVNPTVATDPSTVVLSSTATAAADTTRPAFLYDRLTNGIQGFTAAAGIGSGGGFSGTLSDFAQQVISTQAANSISATNMNDGQKTVLNSIQGRFTEKSGVNLDNELTQLIQLQTAYSANARVMTAAKDLVDMLLSVVQ